MTTTRIRRASAAIAALALAPARGLHVGRRLQRRPVQPPASTAPAPAARAVASAARRRSASRLPDEPARAAAAPARRGR